MVQRSKQKQNVKFQNLHEKQVILQHYFIDSFTYSSAHLLHKFQCYFGMMEVFGMRTGSDSLYKHLIRMLHFNQNQTFKLSNFYFGMTEVFGMKSGMKAGSDSLHKH